MSQEDILPNLVSGDESKLQEILQEIKEQDESEAADENPDYGYATGNREEDQETQQMTGR